jgi:hypothetical protein
MNPPPLPQQPPVAPPEYAGLWIAWDDQRTRVVASGTDVAQVAAEARRLGQKQPLLEKVPRPDMRYVGGL